MAIQNSIGRVVLFQAELSAGVSNVTGNNTNYRVAYDTVIVDTAAGYNVGTSQYTVPVKGFYQISCGVGISGVNDAAFNNYLIDIAAGPTTQIEEFGNPYVQVNPSGNLGKVLSHGVELEAGETVHVDVLVSGGAQTVGVAGGSDISISLIREYV